MRACLSAHRHQHQNAGQPGEQLALLTARSAEPVRRIMRHGLPPWRLCKRYGRCRQRRLGRKPLMPSPTRAPVTRSGSGTLVDGSSQLRHALIAGCRHSSSRPPRSFHERNRLVQLLARNFQRHELHLRMHEDAIAAQIAGPAHGRALLTSRTRAVAAHFYVDVSQTKSFRGAD